MMELYMMILRNWPQALHDIGLPLRLPPLGRSARGSHGVRRSELHRPEIDAAREKLWMFFQVTSCLWKLKRGWESVELYK